MARGRRARRSDLVWKWLLVSWWTPARTGSWSCPPSIRLPKGKQRTNPSALLGRASGHDVPCNRRRSARGSRARAGRRWWWSQRQPGARPLAGGRNLQGRRDPAADHHRSAWRCTRPCGAPSRRSGQPGLVQPSLHAVARADGRTAAAERPLVTPERLDFLLRSSLTGPASWWPMHHTSPCIWDRWGPACRLLAAVRAATIQRWARDGIVSNHPAHGGTHLPDSHRGITRCFHSGTGNGNGNRTATSSPFTPDFFLAHRATTPMWADHPRLMPPSANA